MPHIVIISEDTLLLAALSDIVGRELGAEITAMERPENIGPGVDLVISTLPVAAQGSWRLMLLTPESPRKIHTILAEAALHLADKNHAPLPLADTILLHDKARRLECRGTGATVELTEKEQALLLFIKSEGTATRDGILKNVWGFSADITTSTLETHLYRLRQKWRELADYDCILATDGGYRWYSQ